MGFTTAYLHEPQEPPCEFVDAGLPGARSYGLEGAAWLFGGLGDLLERDRAAVLEALRAVESVALAARGERARHHGRRPAPFNRPRLSPFRRRGSRGA
ncbi:hypothetical protein [Actinomadura opuntiae]|uniref:hypothetical protein n=1 Tax=Actinomadura sp. OS1-43 TaxID=604315 RepID=UPI00255B0B83|nr:hypothetical protein [Actinomadura sp. OS1-43]MDL4821997.1 hypothetical protein [Actinomadura sp. OS1-43]